MKIKEILEKFNLELVDCSNKNNIKINFKNEIITEDELVHMFQLFTVVYEHRIFRVVFNAKTKNKTLYCSQDILKQLYTTGHYNKNLSVYYNLIYTDFYNDSDMMIEF